MKSHIVITRVHHWWLDLYFVRKRMDKKRKEAPFSLSSWCSHHVQYCTMTKHKKRGCCISVSVWIETYFPLFCFSLEASISSTKHGYLLWQCHVSLIKKKKTLKIWAFVMCLICFESSALWRHRDQEKCTTQEHLKAFIFWKKEN